MAGSEHSHQRSGGRGKSWKYYDYAYQAYTPIASCRGKLSSDVLLYNSFSQSPCKKAFLSLVKKIKTKIGSWNTVWGAKLEKGVMTWELYFYDHGIKNPRMTATNVLKVMWPYFKSSAFSKDGIERQPYFMFSLDLSDDIFQSRLIEGVHLYMSGRLGVFQGNSYHWNRDGCILENHYDFYKMPAEAKAFVHKIRQSFVLAPKSASFLKNDLVSRLMDCGTVCVANKRNREGVYFSRVNIEQLVFFLKWFSYPDHIVDFVSSQKRKLDHMLYDVAFDCAPGPEGIVFGKSSYYSIF